MLPVKTDTCLNAKKSLFLLFLTKTKINFLSVPCQTNLQRLSFEGIVKTLHLLRCCIFLFDCDVLWYAEIIGNLRDSHMEFFTRTNGIQTKGSFKFDFFRNLSARRLSENRHFRTSFQDNSVKTETHTLQSRNQ